MHIASIISTTTYLHFVFQSNFLITDKWSDSTIGKLSTACLRFSNYQIFLVKLSTRVLSLESNAIHCSCCQCYPAERWTICSSPKMLTRNGKGCDALSSTGRPIQEIGRPAVSNQNHLDPKRRRFKGKKRKPQQPAQFKTFTVKRSILNETLTTACSELRNLRK